MSAPEIHTEIHRDLPTDTVVVRATQRLHSRTVGALLPISAEMLDDLPAFDTFIAAHLHRAFNPWEYPDRRWTIPFDPFPRWTRLTAWFHRHAPHRRDDTR